MRSMVRSSQGPDAAGSGSAGSRAGAGDNTSTTIASNGVIASGVVSAAVPDRSNFYAVITSNNDIHVQDRYIYGE